MRQKQSSFFSLVRFSTVKGPELWPLGAERAHFASYGSVMEPRRVLTPLSPALRTCCYANQGLSHLACACIKTMAGRQRPTKPGRVFAAKRRGQWRWRLWAFAFTSNSGLCLLDPLMSKFLCFHGSAINCRIASTAAERTSFSLVCFPVSCLSSLSPGSAWAT